MLKASEVYGLYQLADKSWIFSFQYVCVYIFSLIHKEREKRELQQKDRVKLLSRCKRQAVCALKRHSTSFLS